MFCFNIKSETKTEEATVRQTTEPASREDVEMKQEMEKRETKIERRAWLHIWLYDSNEDRTRSGKLQGLIL